MSQPKNVKLNNVTPCKMDDGSFRAIVLPTKTATAIAGSYSITDVSTSGTSTDKTLTYSFTPLHIVHCRMLLHLRGEKPVICHRENTGTHSR